MFVRVRFRKYFLYVSLILHSSLVCELDFSIISSVCVALRIHVLRVSLISRSFPLCEFVFAFNSCGRPEGYFAP